MPLVPAIDRIAPPSGSPTGYHTWSNLLFVHWRVPVEEVAAQVPDELTIDTFDGSAWVGLVLFQMSGVRHRLCPAIPGINAFAETNVRTYVHHEGSHPGVWFFSLDASNSLAVWAARLRWHLNYFRAEMSVTRREDDIAYTSRRLWPRPCNAVTNIEAAIGEPGEWPGRLTEAGHAIPGTLEHFLAERYVLYVLGRRGCLYRGQVHHSPYPLRPARLVRFEESLVAAAGISVSSLPEHAMFSEGVDVEVFGLRRASVSS